MLVCICERQRLPVRHPAEGPGMRRRTGDMQKDRGHAEGPGTCRGKWGMLCLFASITEGALSPQTGFGGGEGSIFRFPVSQDPTDPFLCGSAALHVNSDAEPHVCTGRLLGRAAVLERKQSRVGPCVPGKSRGFAPLRAGLRQQEINFSQGVTCRWPQHPAHRTGRGSSYPKTKRARPLPPHQPKVSFVCWLAFALDLFLAGCMERCGQF